MPRTWTCAQGHVWDAAADETVNDPTATVVCPVCGSAADRTAMPADHSAPTATVIQSDVQPDIPGYEITGELGRGGMGVVYKARQKSLDRTVALKMLLTGPLAGPDELSRLRSEAESIARLQHPNIVHVYDIGEHKGWTYVSLEFIEGGSLAKRLDGRPWPVAAAAELIETLARAVHVAHQRGIVHRDLKPANVLLTLEGTPKISDFGLAKRLDREMGQTRSGAIMGTPAYMAPEQADGKPKATSAATDVYALGTILYELLTGRPPFQGDSAFGVMLQVVSSEPKPPRHLRPNVPDDLEQICLKCLEKNPAHRFPSAADLADALQRFRTGTPLDSHPSRVPAARPPQSNRRFGTFITAACIVLAAGGIATIYRYFGRDGQNSTSNQPPSISEPAVKGEPAASPAPPPTASGRDWSIVSVGPDSDKYERMAFVSGQRGFIASRRQLYTTNDGGATWSSAGALDGHRIFSMAFANENTGWLGTDRLWQTADGGAAFSPVAIAGAPSFAAVSALAVGTVGAAIGGGSAKDGQLLFFRRDASSGAWQLIDPAHAGYWGKNSQFRNWCVGEVCFVGPGVAVAALFNGAGDGGALIATRDGGGSWQVQFESERSLFRVRFADPQHGWLAGADGSFWLTTDGGDHWQERPAADGIAASCLAVAGDFAAAPLWQGEVLISRNGRPWEKHKIADDFGYSMPTAAALADGRMLVLSSDGRLALSPK